MSEHHHHIENDNNAETMVSEDGDNPLCTICMNTCKMYFSSNALEVKWLGTGVLCTIETTRAVHWKDFETDELQIKAYGDDDEDTQHSYSVSFTLHGNRRKILTNLIHRLENDGSIKKFYIVLTEDLAGDD